MSYRIAGIDVHKRMLAVAVSDVEIDGEYEFERKLFGSTHAELQLLVERYTIGAFLGLIARE